jgi:excisionase family DNA binding protein
LKAMGQGKIVSLVPMATEVTTQKAAEILGCSRPHLIKLLQEEKIPFTKVGRHRRIKFEDVMEYKNKTKEEQKQHLIDLMKFDESQGMYDS